MHCCDTGQLVSCESFGVFTSVFIGKKLFKGCEETEPVFPNQFTPDGLLEGSQVSAAVKPIKVMGIQVRRILDVTRHKSLVAMLEFFSHFMPEIRPTGNIYCRPTHCSL